MIDILLNGRLGNQLFMYAMGRKLQIEYKKDILYVNINMLEEHKLQNSLANYKLNDNIKFYNGKVRTRKNVLHGNFLQNIMLMKYFKNTVGRNFNEISEYEDHIEKKYKNLGLFICRDRYKDYKGIKNKNCIIAYGYFQSPKYFDDIKDVLFKELTPKKPILNKNIQLYNQICNTESVCVSVRLGDDFVKNSIYNVCTLNYYEKAIKYMNNRLQNAKFFIFSDRPELLKKKFKHLNVDMIFESGNDPDYEKLRIMSACKHFILANSSFSWWCQYLSSYDKKIVIAPNRWYNGNVPCDIYMDNWCLLEP